MDRQLAQRMVGAACLLAVLVLVVPAILDGNPDSDAIITRPAVDDSLDLRTHTIRLDGDEREPPVPTPLQAAPVAEPAPQEPAAPKPAAPKTAVPETTVAEAPPAEIPPKSVVTEPPDVVEAVRESTRDLSQEPVAPVETALTRADGGDWVVQLGSFSQRTNADRLALDLKRKGFSVSVQSGGGTSGALFRVRAGPVADRPAAEALVTRLSAAGFKGGRVGRQ